MVRVGRGLTYGVNTTVCGGAWTTGALDIAGDANGLQRTDTDLPKGVWQESM